MNIKSTVARPQIATPKAAAAPAAAKEDGNKPSVVDSFSSGAAKGGNFANTAIGVWNGGVTGLIGGAAIGAGSSIIKAVSGAISGDAALGLSSLVDTALSAGLWAAGGAVVGGAAGGLITRGAGKAIGNFSAKATEKLGGNPNVGRAVGTIGTGVLLGTVVGAGVAGWNGAAIALGAGAIGGVVAAVNS